MTQIPTSLPQSTTQDRPVGITDVPPMEPNDTEDEGNVPSIELNDTHMPPIPHQQDSEINDVNTKKQRTHLQRYRKMPVRFEDYEMKR